MCPQVQLCCVPLSLMPVCTVGAMHAVCVLRCNLFVPFALVEDESVHTGIMQVGIVTVGTRVGTRKIAEIR